LTKEMEKEQAKKEGVDGAFWEKYPDIVKVWTIQNSEGDILSRELCGGPHVKDISELKEFGKFKIKKESSSSAGIRRIKVVFEK
jgi:alanyl-tRNA synthetase